MSLDPLINLDTLRKQYGESLWAGMKSFKQTKNIQHASPDSHMLIPDLLFEFGCKIQAAYERGEI